MDPRHAKLSQLLERVREQDISKVGLSQHLIQPTLWQATALTSGGAKLSLLSLLSN